jgi:hypothetical protein
MVILTTQNTLSSFLILVTSFLIHISTNYLFHPLLFKNMIFQNIFIVRLEREGKRNEREIDNKIN